MSVLVTLRKQSAILKKLISESCRRRCHRRIFAGPHLMAIQRRLQSGVFEREMTGAHVLGGRERRSVPFPDNPAAIKDREPVGHGDANRQTLLDKQPG